MGRLSVSVVISSYNYEKYIGTTIESVLAQTYPVSEIIVVDDGSSDNSAGVVRSFGERVRFVEQQNQGACIARNRGARMASGDILAFVDSDDIWLPNKIEKQIEAFEADPEVGLVSCGFRAFGEDGETVFESVEGKNGWVAKEILLFKEPVLNTTASAISVRRSVFETVNGFDERRELFSAEDREFCYRVAKICKLAFIPEALVDYRIHGGNSHLNIDRMEKAFLNYYEKAFNQSDDDTLRIKGETYGNFYTILAGIHFRLGNYGPFMKNSLKALWLTPLNLSRFASFPVRWLRRSLPGASAKTTRPYP